MVRSKFVVACLSLVMGAGLAFGLPHCVPHDVPDSSRFKNDVSRGDPIQGLVAFSINSPTKIVTATRTSDRSQRELLDLGFAKAGDILGVSLDVEDYDDHVCSIAERSGKIRNKLDNHDVTVNIYKADQNGNKTSPATVLDSFPAQFKTWDGPYEFHAWLAGSKALAQALAGNYLIVELQGQYDDIECRATGHTTSKDRSLKLTYFEAGLAMPKIVIAEKDVVCCVHDRNAQVVLTADSLWGPKGVRWDVSPIAGLNYNVFANAGALDVKPNSSAANMYGITATCVDLPAVKDSGNVCVLSARITKKTITPKSTSAGKMRLGYAKVHTEFEVLPDPKKLDFVYLYISNRDGDLVFLDDVQNVSSLDWDGKWNMSPYDTTKPFARPDRGPYSIVVAAAKGKKTCYSNTEKVESTARAVLGRGLEGVLLGPGHDSSVERNLKSIGFDDVALVVSHDKKDVIDALPESLALYVAAHGVAKDPDNSNYTFIGLTMLPTGSTAKPSDLLVPTDMPAGLNLQLIFFNGCVTGVGGVGSVAGRYGSQAYVGWDRVIGLGTVYPTGVKFLSDLAMGTSVRRAIIRTNRVSGAPKLLGYGDTSLVMRMR